MPDSEGSNCLCCRAPPAASSQRIWSGRKPRQLLQINNPGKTSLSDQRRTLGRAWAQSRRAFWHPLWPAEGGAERPICSANIACLSPSWVCERLRTAAWRKAGSLNCCQACYVCLMTFQPACPTQQGPAGTSGYAPIGRGPSWVHARLRTLRIPLSSPT